MEMPVKRRRGRPSLKDSITQHYRPEFFKIYLPEHNSKQLVIPPAFIGNFNGRIPSKFILKNLQGKDWNVELEQDGNKLLMKKGWDRFVIDNSLELGEFLIFVYVSKTTFIVKIFSINGCVKKESTTINDPSYTKVKEEPKLDQESSPSTSSCKTSFKSDVKHEQISDDKCEVMKNVVEGRTTQLKRIRFSKVVDGRPYLSIPAAVFTSNNVEFPNSKKELLLGYGSEVSQVVKLSQTTRRRVQITYGWKAFQLKYNIVKGDECKFEVIVGNDMHIKEIVLLQIRSNSRLIRCR